MTRKRRLALARAARRTTKPFAPQAADVLEERALLSATAVAPIGGTGNNVAHPTWGAAGNDLIRLTPAQYANGVNSPSLPQDASARLISNLVNSQADPANPTENLATVNKQSLTDFVYTFGQFMDHDIDLTQGNGASLPISVPAGDPIGGPNGTPLAFNRSQVDPATGTGTGNPAQQVNSISSYFDLSQVYGSDLATDNALRTFSGGQMKTSPGGLPPLYNSTYFTAAQLAAINAAEGGMANGGPAPQSQLFVTGDTRGNENVELTALQALFLDNHNRLAAELHKENPKWSDQQLFDTARMLNIAQYQSIIYNEWIPSVLGPNALQSYTGYNPNVDASIANEFSTVAFRFGHSLLDGDIERQGNNGLQVADEIPLEQDFFDPSILNGKGQPSQTDPYTGLQSTDIGAILKANADGISQAEDVAIVNEVRNTLFNEVVPGVGFGQDLIALDIQRGRDNGIGSYNEVRQALGLPVVTSFSQITSNVQVQKALQAAYGNVNNIDAIEGGMAEDPVRGSDVGALFQAIMVNQFTRLRDGDRFFYLNEKFTPAEQALLQQGNTLANVIEANTNITNLQSNVFVFRTSISGTVAMNLGTGHLKSVGVPGITVQLRDADGDVVATTKTDRNGNYTFNQFSGTSADPEEAPGVNGTGIYSIALDMPNWLRQTSANPGNVLISRGDLNVSGMNFGIGINWSNLKENSSDRQSPSNEDDLANLKTNLAGSGSMSATNASSPLSSEDGTAWGQTSANGQQTVAANSSTNSMADSLTPSSLIAFLQSLYGSNGLAAADPTNHGKGANSAAALDAVFHPNEFAGLTELLR